MPGNNTEVVHQVTSAFQEVTTAANIGQLSAEQYTALYLLANVTGVYIGFHGHKPFMSVPNNLPEKTFVRFDGIRMCSCEDDPPCTSKYVPSYWQMCTDGRCIILKTYFLIFLRLSQPPSRWGGGSSSIIIFGTLCHFCQFISCSSIS